MPRGRPTIPEGEKKVAITRRIDPVLWRRVLAFAESCSPRVTDTAVIEAALEEYLDRREPKTKKGERQ